MCSALNPTINVCQRLLRYRLCSIKWDIWGEFENNNWREKIDKIDLWTHEFYALFSLMPVVSLWRNGFYFNFSHMKFLNRYKILSPYTWPHFNSNSVVESIAQIIRSVPLPAAEFGIGLTKVFIRSPRTLYELNEFRNLRLNSLATLIQKTFRCYSQKRHYQRMRSSQVLLASAWRTWRVSFSISFTVNENEMNAKDFPSILHGF